ncbi:type VI secretion system tip protein TssI/VgrG [Sorangium sp. So ce134]
MTLLELAFASGESSLSVRHFSVREALSSPFVVSLWARSDDPSLDLAPLVGQPASLRAATGHAFAHLVRGRVWNGVVSYAEQVHADTSHRGLSTYHFRIVPTLWLMTQRRGYRTFQHLSVPDIADQLLGEWGIEPAWNVERARFPRLELRVQYDETDYTFLSRLLEEAGIAFAFVHDEDKGSQLTLTDAPHVATPRAAPPLFYVTNPSLSADRELVTQARIAQNIRPGALTIRAHDFRNPAFPLFAEAPRGTSPDAHYEQYHYHPGAFLMEASAGATDTPVADDRGVARQDQRFGMALAERALLGERADRRTLSFETNAIDLAPGTIFSMALHPHPELTPERKLLVTEFSAEGSSEGGWTMRGQAVFADAPYRPPLRTPKPQVVGAQSATVVGSDRQEVHTDEFGRVRVQFPWDRGGQLDERSSCWIRVSQGWAGAGHGSLALPRVGQEVLVSFIEGDPDQPVVVGRVYNQTQPVPHRLPSNGTTSTWKSDSSRGSGGFNEIRFEDGKGDELLYIQAERSLRRLVKHDETITVLHDLHKKVAANETETTGVNRVEVTGGNRTETTGASRITATGGECAQLVKQNEVERTEGGQKVCVGEDLHTVVKQRQRERVDRDLHVHVKGNRSEQVDRQQSLIVGQARHEEVARRCALDAARHIHLATAEVLVAEAARDVTMSGPGGFIRIDATGVTIKGTVVDINVAGSPGAGAAAKPQEPELPTEARVSGDFIYITFIDGFDRPIEDTPVMFATSRGSKTLRTDGTGTVRYSPGEVGGASIAISYSDDKPPVKWPISLPSSPGHHTIRLSIWSVESESDDV